MPPGGWLGGAVTWASSILLAAFSSILLASSYSILCTCSLLILPHRLWQVHHRSLGLSLVLLLLLVLLVGGGQVGGGQVDGGQVGGGQVEVGQVGGGQVEAPQEVGVPVLLSRATTLVRVGYRLSFLIVNIIKTCTHNTDSTRKKNKKLETPSVI